jgi:PRTRC genetic system protein B
MVNASAVFGNEESASLQAAVLIYGNNSGGSFATAHNIAIDKNGAPSLLEGYPLTIRILNELNAAITKGTETKRSFNGFLPENVLAVGISSVVWWLPATDRNVSFDCSDELIGRASGKTPHPSLVFGVNDNNWSVYALKDNKRPTPETELYQAPYFNVWESGEICQGTSRVPNGATTKQIEGWNTAFFASNFSHPNVHAPNKLVNYKGGSYKFWKDMLDGNFKAFPKRVLVKTDLTLDQFITSTLNGEKR